MSNSSDPGEALDLSREQWWALFDELRTEQQAAYDEVGGAMAFLRQERDDDAPANEMQIPAG